MKKIFAGIILLIFLVFFSLIAILSTVGLETNRFNELISRKIYQFNNNIDIKLNTIKFKINIKKFNLFLETNNSKLIYRNVGIPIKSIKVFTDFNSLINSDPKINKLEISLKKISISELKKVSAALKPSNLKSIINNKILDGELNFDLQIFLANNSIDNIITKGTASNLKIEITKNLKLEKTSFNFFADKTDILIKNIVAHTNFFKVKDGDLKLEISDEIYLESNFNSSVIFNKSQNFIKNLKYLEYIKNFEGKSANSLKLYLDNTYKVKKYNFKTKGSILKSNFDFNNTKLQKSLIERIDNLIIKNSNLEAEFTPKKNSLIIDGKYSLNNNENLDFNLHNVAKGNILNLKINFDYKDIIDLNFINFKKSSNDIAKIFLDLEKNKNNLKIKSASISEKNNLIQLDDFNFKKENLISFKKLFVKTFNNGKKNNDFEIEYVKDIKVRGNYFDATNLIKNLNKKNNKNFLSNVKTNIEIDFKKIIMPFSEELKSFKLIGKIDNGEFLKISSKGDFGKNKFLDISMKDDKQTKRKYFEVYSDLPRPLLSEYSFFEGLIGGNLMFTSIIEKNNSSSKLKIENFKVINAPGMVKLLSLADLGGLADLAEGDGLSFDLLEINMEKKNEVITLNEIVATGPSISVLMEGYQNEKLVSLKGTLVPAKSINKLISKIPVIGDIVIPKEAGEGIFGISFKMKGPPGKIKTTINPIKTITPRFIQKIIEGKKFR